MSDNTLVSSISQTIDANRDIAIEMLQELVAAPSITGAEEPAQDVVERLLRERDLGIDRWEATPEEIAPYYWHVGEETVFAGRPNVVGKRTASGNGRSILLNAHMDTVDYGDESLWTYPPLSGVVKGDLLYGRGSCDMKGGLVSYLLALDALDSLGIRLAGDVTIAATVGEENGGVGALSTILRGHQADAALITEPTRLALVPAQGGSLVLRLTIRGKSAHGAVRDEGVSAIEKFIPIFQDLLAFERERNATLQHPLYDHLSNKIPISFGVLQSRYLGIDRARAASCGGPDRPDSGGGCGRVSGVRYQPDHGCRRQRCLAHESIGRKWNGLAASLRPLRLRLTRPSARQFSKRTRR